MICYGDVQVIPALDADDGWNSDPLLLELDLDLLVQIIECCVIEVRADVAKAGYIQRDGKSQLKLGSGLHQARQVMRLVDILLNEPPILCAAVFLDCHPSLEGMEAA